MGGSVAFQLFIRASRLVSKGQSQYYVLPVELPVLYRYLPASVPVLYADRYYISLLSTGGTDCTVRRLDSPQRTCMYQYTLPNPRFWRFRSMMDRSSRKRRRRKKPATDPSEWMTPKALFCCRSGHFQQRNNEYVINTLLHSTHRHN
jgi:hypothetical protein